MPVSCMCAALAGPLAQRVLWTLTVVIIPVNTVNHVDRQVRCPGLEYGPWDDKARQGFGALGGALGICWFSDYSEHLLTLWVCGEMGEAGRPKKGRCGKHQRGWYLVPGPVAALPTLHISVALPARTDIYFP
jgi:hypothetical protein